MSEIKRNGNKYKILKILNIFGGEISVAHYSRFPIISYKINKNVELNANTSNTYIRELKERGYINIEKNELTGVYKIGLTKKGKEIYDLLTKRNIINGGKK